MDMNTDNGTMENTATETQRKGEEVIMNDQGELKVNPAFRRRWEYHFRLSTLTRYVSFRGLDKLVDETSSSLGLNAENTKMIAAKSEENIENCHYFGRNWQDLIFRRAEHCGSEA
ncbi:hypothetical protein EVAR_73819_1 [Eumeta japonica]|uniref:Uncharacterized protein n=1 Tax=Eumeta variegata TaxID=151549 RepID=A0A4C1TN36_EUMVA|nr:hypothetical protein EVAR_73819_1 [Eumeta japonica]